MTNSITPPEPSQKAKDVAKKDEILRDWLGVKAADRTFQAFWDPSFVPPEKTEPSGEPAGKGWGRAVDLNVFFNNVFGARDTQVRQKPPEPQSTDKSKGGGPA